MEDRLQAQQQMAQQQMQAQMQIAQSQQQAQIMMTFVNSTRPETFLPWISLHSSQMS